MCGITGYISDNITKHEIEKSVNFLKHRGPDNQAIFIEGNLGLGHTRLSILDLSSDANQPIISHSGRYVMVYNGEVYNYKELKQKYNIKTQTTSDSEVVLELFELLGVTFVEELNGMFAISIYDKKQQKLFLFRDRLGIKPLFYFFDNNDFLFSSELKSLLSFNIVRRKAKINHNTIASFLHLGYIPGPYTFYENCYKFPAGNYAVFQNKELEIKKYWLVTDKITSQTYNNLTESKNELNKLLVNSVSSRMISDVPLGTFLSGGIDSSLVTAIAQKISSKPVKTFSIGFKENKFNEAKYAKKIAGYLKTDHHEFIVSENEVLELVDDYFNTYHEPYADSSGFPTMLVSKLAKKHVSVILSGDGGDELFHGYGMYNWAKRLNNPFVKTFRSPIGKSLSIMGNRYNRVSKLFDCNDYSNIKSHIFSQEQYLFSLKEINSLLLNNVSSKILQNKKINTVRNLTFAEEQSIYDINNYLKDDLLVKVDRASMQYALEVRVPLLDHNIVEFALNVNPKLKIKNKEQKYLLKQVLYDYVPEEYFDRPKWGFSIPLEKWLQTDLKYLLDKYTSKEIIEKYAIINYKYVDKLKRDYCNGQTFLYNRLWLIIVLHKNIELMSNC